MNELELRKKIIDTCLYLQKTKLVARTWGNVSARLDNEYFIITPSGLDYKQTKPADLVKVRIDDCSYDENQRKPSSEKKIHANAYKLRKDVNFIIHTHQLYASAICADGHSIMLDDNSFVPCAKYGLPSTDTLAKNVTKEYEKFKNSDMFLMDKHGAIILGKNDKDALKKTIYLEEQCKKAFNARVVKIVEVENPKAYLDDYAQMFPSLKDEDKEAIKLVKEKNNLANLYAIFSKPIGQLDQFIQHFVYKTKYSKLKDK